MTSRTVLITGVAGFLGRYTAREFLRAGWQVVGLDDVSPECAPEKIEFHRLRLPSAALDALLTRVAPAACVHAAGRASVAASLEDPGSDFRDGVVVTFELLDALRRCAPHCRVALLSSAAVYGDPASLPVRETDPVAPLSPYGYHKRQSELLLEEFARLYTVPSFAVRIFSAYGPGLRRQVVWDICERALTTGRLVLHGTGGESRDFVHAADIARGLLHLVQHAPARGEIYNLASGTEATIREVATLLLAHLGLELKPEFDGQRTPGDPVHWRADLGRLHAVGFSPAITREDGLGEVAAWALAELKP
jgi:UDP-glucose 4-epimerase